MHECKVHVGDADKSPIKYNGLNHTVPAGACRRVDNLPSLLSIMRWPILSTLFWHIYLQSTDTQLEMAKRGASFNSGDFNMKSARSDTTLDDVSTGLSGIYTLTDPVRLEGVYWRNPIYRGCSICRRKVDTKCSFHPGSQSKVYYRLRVLIRRCAVMANCVWRNCRWHLGHTG